MNRPQLILAPGKEKSLMRRHPWLFSGAVRKVVGNPQDGDIVNIFDSERQWLAAAHYQPESIIAKVLSFDTPDVDPEQNKDFWKQRLASAVAYRQRLGFFDADKLRHTNVFRMVNGEGDFLPGLIADYYNGVLVLQAHSTGMHRAFPLFVELFAELLDGVLPLKSVFDKSSATLPDATEVSDAYVWGDKPEEWEICESDNRLLINFYEGQKTGFFVDQRENRSLVGNLSKGRNVLNCFGYTGGFSLAALRGGASYVETVDISKKAIELCNRNVSLNFENAPHSGVVADVLKYMGEIEKSKFDVIILDPPAFAKNHRSLQQGLKGYRSINQKAMECIRPGGLLFTFSCSQAVSRDDFQTMAFTAAANAHKHVRIVRQLPHALDHPVSIYHPEGEYLKGLLLEVEN
ncbi:MAG: class I SAM-dependent rRNA methyltransferase [Bacteroidales bacterium]|nr:class I SAM-dependent rRNA methyltransferase [Bacteroidales bacterium]